MSTELIDNWYDHVNKDKKVYGACTARIESEITELLGKFERDELIKEWCMCKSHCPRPSKAACMCKYCHTIIVNKVCSESYCWVTEPRKNR